MVQNHPHIDVTLLQTSLAWEDPQSNLSHLEEKINEIQHTDLVILPEMFTTGFSMKPEKHAENMNGSALRWMQKVSAQKNMTLLGSLIIEDRSNYFNRLFVVYREGDYTFYDKRHLFRMGNEHKHYTPGQERMIFQIRGWRIMPLICYDLRFPVWSRNTGDYDLLVYIANWPQTRRHEWKHLLIARAIENQSYVAGVNRIGSDGNGVTYAGDSLIIDAQGNILSKTEPFRESTDTVSLSFQKLNALRESFPVGKDADTFDIK
jgi:omega-amidase